MTPRSFVPPARGETAPASPRAATIDRARRDRLAAPVVALYWLLVGGGLALYTASRAGEPEAAMALWIGAIAGGMLGQILALRGLRFWVLAIAALGVPVFVAPFVPFSLDGPLWMAFVPAALCGYFSLSERLGLAAFWFPSMLWMLTVLDHVPAGATRPDTSGAVLLGGLALLWLSLLRAREWRRVGLWRKSSSGSLAVESGGAALLREEPGRRIGRFGWLAFVGALTFGLTAWLAPYLWKVETLKAATVVTPEGVALEGALPCCPTEVEAPSDRVREYLDLGRTHLESPPPRQGVDCVACINGVAVSDLLAAAPIIGAGTGDGLPGTVAVVPSAPPLPYVPAERPLRLQDVQPPVPPVLAPPAPPPVALPPSPPPPPTVAPLPPPLPAPPAPTVAAPTVARAAVRPQAAVRAPKPPDDFGLGMLRWFVAIVAGALLFQGLNLLLRPLRRALALRHLARPFWSETVDQRVSNLWQLALVGLRDAGWRATSTEAPREFARRVGVAGIDRCAVVLERARHGVAVDTGDLDEMGAAAREAFVSARRPLGPVARVLAVLRWPLT